MTAKKKICIISLSFISQDSRVLRQIEYLSKSYQLTVIGYGSPPPIVADSSSIEWFEIPLTGPKYLRLAKKLFFRLLQIPFFPKSHPAFSAALISCSKAYLANNWDSLPLAALAARINQSKLVLDLHESIDSWYWGLITPLVKFIFRKYAPDVDASITVVDQLADQHRQFGLNPIVLRNIPNLSVSRSDFKPTDHHKIKLIHHGVATKERSTDLLIKAIALCDRRYELHLVFVNYQSKYVAQLKRLSDKIAKDRVFFYPPFASKEIVDELSSFDIGFYPLPPKTFNHKIALPNKFFEFIAAGLAVAIGPSPNMAKVLQHYRCGIISPSFEPDDLANIINQTTPGSWDTMKMASLKAANELNGHLEMEKLGNIISNIFYHAR